MLHSLCHSNLCLAGALPTLFAYDHQEVGNADQAFANKLRYRAAYS